MCVSKVLYPGVQHASQALPIFVDEGSSLENLTVRLPDFGPKRTFRIRVTDEEGNLEVQIWSNATYSIATRWVGNRTFRERLLDLIPPGKEPLSLVVQLKGF